MYSKIEVMKPQAVKVKHECDLCDGCGWYEGGEYLMTTCNNCGGLGYIEVEKEVPIKHKYTKGEWTKSDVGRSVKERVDVCELCGCSRTVIHGIRRGEPIYFNLYTRNKIHYHDKAPECWGAKNPI